MYGDQSDYTVNRVSYVMYSGVCHEKLVYELSFRY